MNPHAQQIYLETQILTSTPQKLRLMLIEGAIRFLNQELQARERGDEQEFVSLVSRCRDIATELLVSIRADGQEITNVSRGIYAFLIRTLADIELRHDPEPVAGVLRVLEEERITWTQVCELQPDLLSPTQSAASSGFSDAGHEPLSWPNTTLPGSSQISFDA